MSCLVQVIWSSNKVWFAWAGNLDWLCVSTVSLLTPLMTSYPATVSFCPAHPWSEVGGHMKFYSNDAVSALQDVMSRNGLDSLVGSWVFRNIGSVRDSMSIDGITISNDYLQIWSAPFDYDSCFPPGLRCAYCANPVCWKAAYTVGSLCYNSKKPIYNFEALYASSVAVDPFSPPCQNVWYGDF